MSTRRQWTADASDPHLPIATEVSYCPYCGSDTATPVTVYSSEYQGDSPHGGMVEWADQMCSECAPRRPYRDD